MPPRFVYWTILIDNKPTAFRAHDRDDLLPTVTQLRRTNKDVVVKYFARGRVWDSPEQVREHFSSKPVEKRARDWRPGGSHEDPRARFDPKKRRERDKQTPREAYNRPAKPDAARSSRGPWSPSKPPAARPWQKDRPRSDRPIPSRPGTNRSSGTRPDDSRPWRADRPDSSRRPWQDKPRRPDERNSSARPWSPKPSGPPPWKTARKEERPWQRKPSGPSTSGSSRRPWNKPPHPKKPKPPEDE